MEPIQDPETLTLPEAIRQVRKRASGGAFLNVFAQAEMRANADDLDYIDALEAELQLRLKD